MRFSLVLAALLCFTTWMSVVHSTHGPVTSCCLQWSTTRVKLERIKNYTIQSEGICPITAVIFQTKFGKRLCSDPNSNWAKRAILKVDKETKALLQDIQKEDRSASDITPAASTPSKNAPQEKYRNRRRQKKKCRRARKGQRKCV